MIQGPELPFTISQHGMVKISENAIYIIGGRQDDAISQDVWIIDPKDQYSVKKGPSLKTSRLVPTGLWNLKKMVKFSITIINGKTKFWEEILSHLKVGSIFVISIR